MTVKRSGPRVPATTTEKLVEAVDSRIANEDAGSTELMLMQTFAAAWAVVGLVVWTVLVWTWRVLAWIGLLLVSPWRRKRPAAGPDEGWTTTQRYKGRLVK